MREYELTVVYDLAVAEAGGPDAAVQQLQTVVEARGGTVAKVDHWGRRRMAYPINRAIDGDYIVSRIEIDPSSVTALEATLRIDERVYRHLVVRADELPVPPPPREPRRMPGEAAAEAPSAEAPAIETAEAAPEAEAAIAAEPAAAVVEAATEAEVAPAAEAVPATDETPAEPEAAASEAPAE